MRHSATLPALLGTIASRRAFLKRVVVMGATIPILGSVLAACGGDDADDDAPAAASEAESTATATSETATETPAGAPSSTATETPAGKPTSAGTDATAPAGTAMAASRQLAFAGAPEGIVGIEGAPASAVYLVGSDGAGLDAIWTWKTAGSHAVSLVWSPYGRHLAFYGHDAGDGSVGLYVLDADRGNLTNLVDGDFFGPPTWSPDGRQLYISVPRSSAIADGGILAVPADGSAAPTWLITLQELDMHIPTLSVSPDGQTIAALVGGPPQLVVMRVDDPQTRVVVSETADGGVWSPDSQQLAFIGRSSDGIGQLYVVNADGTQLTKVSDVQPPNAVASGLAWSPDGQQIAYTVYHAATPETQQQEVYVSAVDGSQTLNLTNDPEYVDTGPSWSPDGRAVAFVSQPADAWRVADPSGEEPMIADIRVIMTDGTHPRTVVAGVGFEHFMELIGQPAWRPTAP